MQIFKSVTNFAKHEIRIEAIFFTAALFFFQATENKGKFDNLSFWEILRLKS